MATSGPYKGGQKTGGRKAGTPNKVSSLAAQKLVKTELTSDVVVEAIRRGALADIGDVFDGEGNIRPLHELTEAQRFLIAGVEVVMKNATAGDGKIDRILKIKWADRSRYVELAAKYHSLLTEKVDVSVTEVGNRLDRARQVAMARNATRRKGTGSGE